MSNGYGNQYGINDDYYSRMDNTKPINDRDPFIGEGLHKLQVISIEEYNHVNEQDRRKSKGPTARATFVVVESPTHTPGTRVTKLWILTQPANFPNQPDDGARFADFLRKLKGAPAGTPMGQQCRTLLRDRVNDQLARGTTIMAYGRNVSKKADKPFVDVTWAHFEGQTPETIRAARAKIESTPGLIREKRGPQGQQNGAPQGQQQYAPQGYAPAQAPVQGFGSGVAMQQGYAPAPAPAPQTGGYGAELPPAPGNNSGNTGGGW